MTQKRKLPGASSSFFAAVVAGLMTATGAMAAEVSVELNHSRLFMLPEPATTMVISNPAIADVTIEDRAQLIVHGRSYGATNVIALDEEGREITNLRVNVTGNSHRNVTLHRGVDQYSFNCAGSGQCVRVLRPGDNTESFATLESQAGSIASMARDASRN